jgi:hypothetical protein
MENSERRAIIFEALVTDVQVLIVETQGMNFENKQREIIGENVAYTGADFFEKAAEIREIAEKMRSMLD